MEYDPFSEKGISRVGQSRDQLSWIEHRYARSVTFPRTMVAEIATTLFNFSCATNIMFSKKSSSDQLNITKGKKPRANVCSARKKIHCSVFVKPSDETQKTNKSFRTQFVHSQYNA